MFGSGRQVRVEGRAADDSGVRKVDISYDGSAWFLANGTNNWSLLLSLDPGIHRIQVRATDLAGRVAQSEVTIRIQQGPASGSGTLWLMTAAAAAVAVIGIIVALSMLRGDKRDGRRARGKPGR